MNVRRMFLLLALAALAWIGFGEARAQDQYADCMNMDESLAMCQTREIAYNAIIAYANHRLATASACVNGLTTYGAPIYGTSTGYDFYRVQSSGGSTICQSGINAARRRFPKGADECPESTVWFAGSVNKCLSPCGTRPSVTYKPVGNYLIRNGSTKCIDHCKVALHSNGDGTFTGNHNHPDSGQCLSPTDTNCTPQQLVAGWHDNFTQGNCQPPADACPAGEIKDPHSGECKPGCSAPYVLNALNECTLTDDQCPAGMIKSPEGHCLPGAGQCAVGEAKKPDGTCGPDSDGDGEADEFDPETDRPEFSGGDSCDAPPSCSGDAIMCGQARIQWRIECNTRNDAKVSGGSCEAVPACVGKNCNALEYAQLLQQWRTSCALEGLAQGGSTGGEGGQPEWTQVSGDGTEGVGPEPEEGTYKKRLQLGVNLLDQGGLGVSGTCPSFGSLDLGIFGTFNIDALGWVCEFVSIVGPMIFLMGCFVALVILFKG